MRAPSRSLTSRNRPEDQSGFRGGSPGVKGLARAASPTRATSHDRYGEPASPALAKSAAPECGQHTEEVLLENGYSWEQIAELKSQEII